MGSSNLLGFWMSIINDSSIQEQLTSVMGVQDMEERALALLSRTLFLLIMEIKFERDEALKTSGTVMEVITGCDSCRKKVKADELTNKTVMNSIAFYTESRPVKDGCEKTNTISGEICEASQHSDGNRESRGASRGHTAHLGEAVGGLKGAESHSFTSQKVKSSVSPCREVDKEDVPVTGIQMARVILVPGTMDVMESQPLESPLEKTFITQKVFVPETLCMDDYKPHDISDIFEDCDEGNTTETQTLAFAPTEHRTSDEWCSPVKSPAKTELRREDQKKYSSTSRRGTRQDTSKMQQQEMVKNAKPQRNSSNDTIQQGQEASTATLQQDDYIEDVLVESDNVFRSPGKGSGHSFRSPPSVTTESRTPTKTGCNVSKTPEGSPVFGKGSRNKRHPQASTDVRRNISEALSTEQGRVEIMRPQNETPGQRETSEKGKASPGSGRLKGNRAVLSPLPSPHNISDDLTSPSLLQPFGSASSTKMEPPLCPSSANHKKAPRGERGGALPRPASSLGTSASSRKLSLRRHHTTDAKQADKTGGTGIGKLHVSTPDSHRKKTGYRQTTVDIFLSPQIAGTKASGSATRRIFLDDEEALRLALEESLQLKALADMGRELDQREEEGRVALQGGHGTLLHKQNTRISPQAASRDPSTSLGLPRTPNKACQPSKESPIKLPNLRLSHSSPSQAHNSLRSPKSAHSSFGSPKSAHRSPRSEGGSPSKVKHSAKRKIIEEEEEGLRRGRQGKVMEGEDEAKTGLRRNAKKEELEEKEEPKRGGKVKENEKKSKTGSKRKTKEGEEEEKEEEEEILEFVSAQEEVKVSAGKETKENVSSRRDGEGEDRPPPRKTRRAVFDDSFDVLPQKEEPKFAHQGEVVRKKAPRRQLEGWACKQCKEFYEKAGSNTEEVKELMNKCSRHRSKYKPLSNTPEGFWNPFFDD